MKAGIFLENKLREGKLSLSKIEGGGQNFNQLLSPAELLRGGTGT